MYAKEMEIHKYNLHIGSFIYAITIMNFSYYDLKTIRIFCNTGKETYWWKNDKETYGHYHYKLKLRIK